MKAFADYLLNITDKDVDKLNKDKLEVTLNGTDYKVTTDMVETRISSKEGYNVAVENNKFVILNTELTKDLLNEGLARETISKVQQLRKSNNFEVTDRIKVYCNATKEYMDNLKDYLDFVKEETLCVEFIPTQDKLEEVDVNDYKVEFKLEKVK